MSSITKPDEERFHKIYIDTITNKILAHQNSESSLVLLPITNAYPSVGSVPPSATAD